MTWWKKGKGLPDSHQKLSTKYNDDWEKWFEERKDITITKEMILRKGKEMMTSKKYNFGNNIGEINF